MNARERIIEEAEKPFETRVDIAGDRADTHGAMESCIRFPSFAPALHALREASAQGICSTKLLIPRSPRATAVVLLWRHRAPLGIMRENAVEVNAHLFRLWHLLRKTGADNSVVFEGPPYECTLLPDRALNIPETTVSVHEEEGQRMLLAQPALLRRMIRELKCTFEPLVVLRPGSYRGLEKPASYEMSLRMLEHIPNTAMDAVSEKILSAALQGEVGISRSEPRHIIAGGFTMPFLELINRCNRYCAAIEALDASHHRRETEAVDRMREAAERNETAKVFMGANHQLGITSLCAQQNIAVAIVQPTGLNITLEEHFEYRADPSNMNYAAVKELLKHFLHIASQLR